MRFTVTASVLLLTVGAVQAKPPEDPKVAEARQHFESGLARYNLKEYRAAIDELPRSPGFLRAHLASRSR